MEHKKDIGELLEKRLQAGAHSPKDSLWDRLDTSLEKAARKRRRMFWLWSSGIVLVAIGLSVILLQPGNSTSEPVKLNSNNTLSAYDDTDDEISIAEEKSAIDSEIVLTEPSMEEKSENSVPLDKIDNSEEGTPKAVKTAEKRPSETNDPSKDSLVENGFTKKTTHQYFNSETGTTVYGTKREIDSIARLNKIKMAKKDSIARARAADSIKLNERTRDSIN